MSQKERLHLYGHDVARAAATGASLAPKTAPSSKPKCIQLPFSLLAASKRWIIHLPWRLLTTSKSWNEVGGTSSQIRFPRCFGHCVL